MFGRLFGLKPLDKEKIRKSLYQPPIEEGGREEKKRKLEDVKIESKDKYPFRPGLGGKKVIGLKTVVDTRRALEEGVRPLLDIYGANSALSSFFMACGNDSRGESFLSLLDPSFHSENSRTQKVRREGFKTAYSGLLSPSPPRFRWAVRGRFRDNKERARCRSLRFSPAKWKSAVSSRNEDAVALNYERGLSEFEDLLRIRARSFAAPFFLCSNATILLQENFAFDFASDCRGTDPFLPVIDPRVMKTPQVPVTLPTVTEWLAAGNGDERSFTSSS